eukprot:TRINITY_DN64219_c0_g2_i1.p1 TRINITY_DN64219_c0_g2~~TRINITY_DN64219_c0_g2_i1.p1  ORF type:complete len:642 (-),score=58.94 TRINITY_DN64219_c0_g2_i1:612-2537(-)
MANVNDGVLLEEVVQYWKKLDFAAKVESLDAATIQVAKNKEESLLGRKRLQTITTDFRKADDATKLKGVTDVLKAYQAEINEMIKRSRFAENSFLETFRLLRDAPDPTPIDPARLRNSHKDEEEITRLRKKLDEYEKATAKLKNQDITIENLQNTVRQYSEQMEESIKTAMEERLGDYYTENSSLVESLQENERLLNQKIQQQMEDLRQKAHLQDFVRSEVEEALAAKEEAEVAKEQIETLLSVENDRLTAKCASLENQMLLMRREIEKQNEGLPSKSTVEELESLLTIKDADLLRLADQKTAVEARLQQKEDQMKLLEEKVEEKNSAILKLTSRVESLPTTADYEQLQRRLQQLEDLEHWTSGIDDLTSSQTEHTPQGIVAQLKEELTSVKMQHTELQTKHLSTQKELEQSKQTVHQQGDLITKLEDDIMNKFDVALDLPKSGFDLSVIVDNPSGPPHSSSGSSTTGGNTELYKIVANQRDRFKKRMRELEDEKNQLEQRLRGSLTHLKELENDNLSLYGKMRYLEHYASEKTGNRMPVVRGNGYDIEDTEYGRYKRVYEDSINPFNEFHAKEREKEIRKLSPPERVILIVAKLLLSHKYGRYALFVYALLLHLMVFGVLYRMRARGGNRAAHPMLTHHT